MKKIMFFVAALLLSTIMFSCKKDDKKTDPQNPAEEEEVYPEIGARNCILLEEFTGQDCGNCPRAIKAIRETIESMPEGNRVAWVAHHSGYLDDDFTLAGDLTIASKFGVNYAPAGILERTKTKLADGNNSYDHIADYFADADLFNEYLAVPAEASMNLKVKLSADNQLTVTVLGKCNPEEAYITVLLCQNGIKARQASGGASYVHNEVVRAYLTPAAGEQLSIDGEKKYKFTTTYQIPESISNKKGTKSFATDIPNMYVVAFVAGKLASKGAVYNTDMVYLNTLQ